jgi:glycerophosphoryl diester phosphodiesterase
VSKFALSTLFFLSIVVPDFARAADDIVMPTRGISAHRGASTTHPENTLAAFREAIRLGVHQIEFDIRMTKDGHIVLMHDATVDRTTNGKGPVTELTLEQIRSLDAGIRKGPKFAGERVPTFQETLQMMPVNIWLNVHTYGDPALAEAATREIIRQKRTHQAFLAIGHRGADVARRVYPDILICNMQRQGENVPRYAAETIERGDAFIQILSRQGIDWPDQIRALKQAGVRINYCCTNDPDTLDPLFKAGVDFPLVDDAGNMMEAARRLGIEPWKPVYRQP